MRRFAVLVLLAACGGPNPPATPHVRLPDAGPAAAAVPDAAPAGSGIDWATVPHATDDDVLAIWRRLDVTPDTWWNALGEIPGDVLEDMAIVFLREGNFACPSVQHLAGCTPIREFDEVQPTDGIDSPCLRRQIALWALDQLESDTIEKELSADMIALAGLPPPEDELNRAAFYRIEDGSLRLQMLDAAERAGNETVADESLGNLSTSQMIDAVHLHVDGAVDVLAVEDALQPFEDALADEKLRPETRYRVAAELDSYGVGLDPDDAMYQHILEALQRGTQSADCSVAAASWLSLADLTSKPFPSKPPKGAKEPAILRTLCLVLSARGDDSALWPAITASTGIVWRSTYIGADPNLEPGDDPDAEPDATKTWSEVRHLRRADLGELLSDSELQRALTNCTGTTCTDPKEHLTFTFTFKKSGAKLLLDTIERKEQPCSLDSD